MDFQDLRVKDIHSVVIYDTNMTQWFAKNRKNHIIGIKLEGSALHDFGYQEFVMSKNTIYFLNQKDDYNVTVYEPGASFSIHFTTYEEIDTDSFCLSVSTPDKFVSILKKAEMNHGSDRKLSAMSLLYQLCSEFFKIHQKTYFPKDKRAIEAKLYMDVHFKEKNCLSDAVKECNLTSRRFGEIFRKNFDITPNHYITLRKIEHAKALLISGLFSVSEVSEQCGFSDVYYFSKVFKKYTGVIPSKW